MELTAFSAIKSATVPADWTLAAQKHTGIMAMSSWSPPGDDEVFITFFRRSSSLPEEGIKALKLSLSRPPHKIADASQELLDISPVLGHAGKNQWTSRTSANFRLIQAETMMIGIRTVLYIRGAFIDPTDRKGINEYCSVFVDVPKNNGVIEEVYLQVPSKSGLLQFEKYRKVFLEVMESMEWK